LGLTAPETDLDWLCLPDQRLLEWTGGEVFHDAIGLSAARSRFAALPENVRMYRIAASWANIGEEAAFVGRTGDVGDDIGSRIIAARLARRAMLLAFLLEGRYPPYSKWLGTAFRQLDLAARMQPVL
ncbi:MAG TPA: DUF4037 domain-containing protein, partial [Clostridia bacterium]|nr:DUF4037 domain-containing protein [Clostridia bacterium]